VDCHERAQNAAVDGARALHSCTDALTILMIQDGGLHVPCAQTKSRRHFRAEEVRNRLPKNAKQIKSEPDRKKTVKAPRPDGAEIAVSKLFRIGAVAKRLGISASMIRAWERLGLRREATREGAHRLYSEDDVQLLSRAVYLRRIQRLNAPAIIDQLQREGQLPGSSSARPAARIRATGNHLRALRLERGQSLAQVAAAVGISTGFLSNLERSQTGVSLGIMHRLAQHYGTSLSKFFYQADSPGPLVRKGKGRALAGGDGVRMEILAWGEIAMEPHIFHVAPGKGSAEPYSHEGEEFLYLVRGALCITLDEEVFQLKQGDSFYFASKVKHSWLNRGKTEAVIIWINSPSASEMRGI
jgi:DNA-binding transcriptional MerR regulator